MVPNAIDQGAMAPPRLHASSAVHSALEAAKHDERNARLRLAWLQRQLHHAKKHQAHENTRVAKLRHAAETRHSLVRARVSRGGVAPPRPLADDASASASTSAANLETLDALSAQLNARLALLFPPPSTPSWFKLFRLADEDDAGHISFGAFCLLLRTHLELPPRLLPQHEIRAAWRLLDPDGSGFLSRSAFGALMRRAEAAEGTRRARSSGEHDGASDGGSRPLSPLRRRAPRKASRRAPRLASDSQLDELVERMNRRLERLYPDVENGGWLRLYRETDERGTGTLTFEQLSEMIRTKLGLSRSHVSERELQSAWRALDTGSRGFVTRGEFGALMRRGAQASGVRSAARAAPPPTRAVQAEAILRAVRTERAAEVERARREAEQHTRELDKRAYRLAVELSNLCGSGDASDAASCPSVDARPASSPQQLRPRPPPARDATSRARPASARVLTDQAAKPSRMAKLRRGGATAFGVRLAGTGEPTGAHYVISSDLTRLE